MIYIYKKGTSDYSHGGKVIEPTKCELSMEINSTWKVDMSMYIEAEGADWIDYEAVIRVPSPLGYQLYQIIDYTKTDTEVECTAYPLAMVYLQKSVFHFDTRPTNDTCIQALDALLSTSNLSYIDEDGKDCKLVGESNITDVSTAYWQLKTGIECLSGSEENSILNRWGGEIEWDNNIIRVRKKIGISLQDRDWIYPITLGFNMQSIDIQYDYSDVCTRIIPKAYNGYLLPDNGYVVSDKDKNYNVPIYKVIEYSNVKLKDDASSDSDTDVVFETTDEMYKYMKQLASEEFTVNHLDEPSFVCNVSVLDLYQVPKYKDFKTYLELGLGDYVKVYQKDLEVNTDARVTAIKYDCISSMTTDLTIGSTGKNYFYDKTDMNRTLTKTVSTDKGSLNLEHTTGILHGQNTVYDVGTPITQASDTWINVDNGSAQFGENVFFKGTIATEKDIYAGGNIYLQDIDSETGWKYGQLGIGRFNAATKKLDSSSTKYSPRLRMQSGENGVSSIAIEANPDNGFAYVWATNYKDGKRTPYALLYAQDNSGNYSYFEANDETVKIVSAKDVVVKANGKSGVGITGTFKNVTGFKTIGGLVTSVTYKTS